MKHLILILSIFCISIQTYATDNNLNSPRKIELHLEKYNTPRNTFSYSTSRSGTGIGIAAGGALFMIGGLTTSTEVHGFTDKDKSFLGNTARAAAIITGGLLMTTGIIISISK